VTIGPHTLVTGKTDSGKSSIMRMLLPTIRRNYAGVLILDFKTDPKWNDCGGPVDLLTDDRDAFMSAVETTEDHLLIIDEGKKTIGRYAEEMEDIATMYRELGHSAYFLSQRGAQINKTIREQCSNAFVLNQGDDDAKELAKNFPRLKPLIKDVPLLRQGEYIFLPSFGDPVRGRAW